MRIFYSADAIEDLERLRLFIAEHNAAAANRIALQLVSKIKLLADSPRLGVAINHSDAPQNMRQLVVGNYIVRYQFSEKSIMILRIWHHKEDRGV